MSSDPRTPACAHVCLQGPTTQAAVDRPCCLVPVRVVSVLYRDCGERPGALWCQFKPPANRKTLREKHTALHVITRVGPPLWRIAHEIPRCQYKYTFVYAAGQ